MGLLDWLFGGSEPERHERRPAPSRPAAARSSMDLAPKGGGDAPVWKKGDRVLAKWHDSYFYPAVIGQVADKTCEVFYDDGDVAWVHKQHIQSPDIQVGDRVYCRVQRGPTYAPGVVKQQKGDTILVQYDQGQQEWTSIAFCRVERPIADVGAEEPGPNQPPPEPVKQDIDLGEPIDDLTWRVGDRVLARWIDLYWYPGTILGMGSKGLHILYDDGDQRIIADNMLMALHVEEGETIYIRPKNEPQRIYVPATVTRASGETVDVELEDGLHENNCRLSRARLWRSPVDAAGFAFDEGDRVLACDIDQATYPAEIISIDDDKIIVQFLDGPERMLTPERIQKFNLTEGSRVECRWKAGPHYFGGVIQQLQGERVFLKYDDGDEEWTSVRLVRLPPTTPQL